MWWSRECAAMCAMARSIVGMNLGAMAHLALMIVRVVEKWSLLVMEISVLTSKVRTYVASRACVPHPEQCGNAILGRIEDVTVGQKPDKLLKTGIFYGPAGLSGCGIDLMV